MGKKTVYSDDFKQKVLEFYKAEGPKKASEKFGVTKHLILQWRRVHTKFNCEAYNKNSDKIISRSKRKHYTDDFKITVLKHFEEFGERATAEKFDLNSGLLYKWRQQADTFKNSDSDDGKIVIKSEVEEVERYSKPTNKRKKEILEFYLQFGKDATMQKFKITQKRLFNWRKRFNSEFDGVLYHEGSKTRGPLPPAEKLFRQEVVSYCQDHGMLKTTEKFDVSAAQVIKWKRAKRPKKPESIGIDKVKRRSSLEKKSQKSYDEATKEAAIKCYLEEGAFACERKHKIPRQSVRNWALARGLVEEKEDNIKQILESATKEGVQNTLKKFSVSRASLYNWANKYNATMFENTEDQSIYIKVSEGSERKIIFLKKREKPLKVPKVREKKESKRQKRKREREEEEKATDFTVVPDWVLDFIKKKVPKVDFAKDNTNVEVNSNDIIYEGEIFTLTTGMLDNDDNDKISDEVPVIKSEFHTEVDLNENDVDGEDDEDDEANGDYVELDIFNTMPFFSPNF